MPFLCPPKFALQKKIGQCYNYSIKNKKLFLKVHWLEPYIEDRKIKSEWRYERIDFEKKIYDKENYRVYYYDYDRNLKIKNYWLKKERIFDIIRTDDNYSKRIDLFQNLVNDLDEYNLEKWNDKNDIYKLYDLFRILLSIKERKNYTYKNSNVIWMLNMFYNTNKELYWLVLQYIENTNFNEVLLGEKKYSTFLNHNKEYAMSKIKKDNRYTEYMHWFFPEIKTKTNDV
jgi:hypothetical protein